MVSENGVRGGNKRVSERVESSVVTLLGEELMTVVLNYDAAETKFSGILPSVGIYSAQ